MDQATRDLVRERAEACCEYCRVSDGAYPVPFHVEHIVASVHQRDDRPDNLAWACPRCNAYKGPNLATIDPDGGTQVQLFNPREHRREEHFELRDGVINGLTPIGRGAVRLLQMNQPQRVALRLLFSA